MNEVAVLGELPIAHQVAIYANTHQKQYRFTVTRDLQGLALHINAEPYHGLFRVFDENTVVVSTWQSEGLCSYSGLEIREYLTLCSLLGLAQARAVQLNPIMRVEDFAHTNVDNCLFSTLPLKQQFAGLLERPHVCSGCIEFYRCLQLEPEMEGLARFVQRFREPSGIHGSM